MIEFNIDEGLQLLNIAERDLKASKCLCLDKLYPQALFYYQQSIEKAFKTIFYSLGLLSYKEMKEDISHNPLNIFVLISDEKSSNNIAKIKLNFPKIGETRFIDILSKSYSAKSEDVVRKSFQIPREIQNDDKGIKDMIKYLNNYYKETIEINSKGKDSDFYKKLIMNMESEVKGIFEEFFESLAFYPALSDIFKNIEIKKEIEKVFDLFKKILIPFFTTSIYLSISLIIVSFLTKSLAIKTRYIEKDCNPLECYKTNHPLVLNLEGLSELQNKNLTLLKNWLGYLKGTPEELKKYYEF
jgi:hypothetical protein